MGRALHLFISLVIVGAGFAGAQTVTITSTQAQTAVLDPVSWQSVLTKERYFDAIRPLLVRFPGIADVVAAKVREGYAIEKAELVLEWEKQEGARPERGRHGWGSEDAYTKDPGRWSAYATPLTKPWSVDDPTLGPTADAYVSGRGYWRRLCALDAPADSLAWRATPRPLHAESPVATLDVTALLGEAGYGKSLGARLRGFEERGVKINKLELVDLKYNGQEGGWFDVYSWRVPTGYMKIWVKTPKLVVTLRKDPSGAKSLGTLPAPLNFPAFAAALQQNPDGASCMAPPADWAARVARHTTKPAAMPEWEWQRLQELRGIWGRNLGRFSADPLISLDPAKYNKALAGLLETPPHYWHGHLTSDFAFLPYAYGDLLPPGVIDYLKIYWTGWLHPEVADAENPRSRSYFRSYPLSLGTQNFSTNSIAGCYLGGQLLGSAHVLRDARHGLENAIVRNWGFFNGVNQEAGDTYYQGLSVAGLNLIGKYAQDPYDRLLGQIAADRQVEQLITVYHPGLRRITYPMGRGELKYQLLYQDGPYHAVHALSRHGALLHLDKTKPEEKLHQVQVFGGEGPPARYAELAPWGPAEWANVVDDKRYPWDVHARWWHLDPDTERSGWHVHHLGANYALASRSEFHGYAAVTPVTAQWRREAKTVTDMEELSTLQFSYGINGVFAQSIVQAGVVQQGGKLLAMTPLPFRGAMTSLPNPDYAGGWRAKDPNYNPSSHNAIHASIAITTFGDVAGREVWINGQKIDKLSGAASPANPDPKYEWDRSLRVTGKNSVFAKEGDRIYLKDGVTYLALIPVTLNALPREEQVEIAYEWPILYVNNFLYRDAKGADLDAIYAAERKPSAGFVIELGDASEYGSFAAFRRHIEATKLTVAWNARGYHDLAYRSGADTLEMGFAAWDMGKAFHEGNVGPAYLRVNGKDDYGYPLGIHRDSPWSIQGSTGKLSKGGATLESEPGYRTYLLAEGTSGTYTAYNPTPDPIFWRFLVPGGRTVRADGRVGLLRVRATGERLWIDAPRASTPPTPAMASALLLTGHTTKPQVTLNGQPLTKLATVKLEGMLAYVVPLAAKVDLPRLPARLATADAKWQAVAASPAQQTYFQDWYIVGPFDNQDYAAQNFHLKDFGPETGLDLTAKYAGLKPGEKGPVPTDVRWRALLPDGQPALAALPVDLLKAFALNRGVIAYLATTLVSDRPRTVHLLTGGNERLGVWVNGQQVVNVRGYRLAYRDQDRVTLQLKPGENPVVLKLAHGYEQWHLYFRLADEWGLPLTEGVSYKGPHGVVPAGG
jgi:hypothetical protein